MKRILFVDDEVATLASIKAALESRADAWQMDFVESGEAALSALQKQPYDLICCDMQMPGMDGAQVLNRVNDRWPNIVRVVMTGYAHMEQAQRLVPIAHEFLSKPCEAEKFGSTLERCLKVKSMLDRPELRALIGRVKKFPVVPKTYGKLRAMLAQPNASMTEVAKIVAADVAISAKVLQVVNSAYFRLPRQITKVDQAVSFLGLATVRNLVLSVEIFSQWSKLGAAKCGMDADKMLTQSLLSAAVARNLATGTSLSDDALVGGLLCDVGYLILVSEASNDLVRAKKLAHEKRISQHEAEREVLGVSHADVGAYLLALWGFHYSIVEAVAFHHEPRAAAHSEFDLLTLLSIASVLTDDAVAYATNVMTDEYLQSVHAPFTWAEAQQHMQAVKSAGEPVGA